MSNAIRDFSINPETSGQILSSMLKRAGTSMTNAATAIGVQYDTLRKCLGGDVQRVSLDIIIKVCKITGHTLQDYFRMYFEAEGTHLFDDVISCSKDHCPHKSEIPSAHTEDSSGRTAHHNCPALDHFSQQLNVVQENTLNRYKAIHGEYTKVLTDSHALELDMLDKRYEASVNHLKRQIKRLEIKNTIITCVLVLENILLASVLIYDALNPGIGWFRSFIDRGVTPITFGKS